MLCDVPPVVVAAAPLKSNVQNAVSERLDATIVKSWSMSETTVYLQVSPVSHDGQHV